MGTNAGWREIVASSLDWEQAHANFDHAINNLPADLRGKRPQAFAHSVWELVDHIRRIQHDLLEFCVNPRYEEPTWPDDYWPSPTDPPTEQGWSDSVAAVRRDVAALAEFAKSGDVDLTAKIPHGTGQTYLRTILVAVDHTSYHVGQIIAVRRLLNCWPPT